MANMVAWLLATVITLPIIGWYFIYITTVKLTKNKTKSVRLASDWSAILFMASVYFIIDEVWGQSLIWLILALFFLIAIIFTWMHWKFAGDIHIRKLVKGIWRINFMLYLFFYIMLSGYGLIVRIIS